MIRNADEQEIINLLAYMRSVENDNFKFANGAHSLWVRFHNYEKNPPFVIEDEDGDIAAVCMITKLQREPYANLYEIFAVHPGYATKLYWGIMEHMYNNGVQRLKMSCTPDSIGWHKRNGIVGWAIDPTGSIRVDIPILPTLEEQLALRELAVNEPQLVMPPEKNALKFIQEQNRFGPRKQEKVDKAVDTLGEFYLRAFLPEEGR